MASLFNYNFRLSPWEGCLNLNFDNETFPNGFNAVCTRDHLGILWSGDPAHNDAARAAAHSLARALVHADALLTFPNGIVLDVEPMTWLEIRDCVQTKIVSGYMHQSLGTAPLDPNHPDKLRLRKAASIVRSISNSPALELAIADFHTARREQGPYLSFYAFRVLEDIGFHFGTTKNDKPDWDLMNSTLGTNKDKWQSLTEAGTRARHLNKKTKPAAPSSAQMKSLDFLGLAHKALVLTLKKLGLDI